MTENEFIIRNKEKWEKLNSLIIKKNKNFNDIMEFRNLYQLATEHLSLAKTYFFESSTIDYLNDLIKKSHLILYRPSKPKLKKVIDFFLIIFPKTFFDLEKTFLLTLAVFLFSIFFSFWIVNNNTELAEMFLDTNTFEMVKNDLELRKQFGNFDNIPPESRPQVSFFIWFNNSKVALLSFVFGITLGIGTLYVILTNGFMLGALLSIYYMNGNFIDFLSLIMIHGTLELFAIVLSSSAGFYITQSILFPGRNSRLEKLKKNTYQSFQCLIGVIILLLFAGLIEGFITPMKLPVSIRFVIISLDALFLVIYFFLTYIILKKGKN